MPTRRRVRGSCRAPAAARAYPRRRAPRKWRSGRPSTSEGWRRSPLPPLSPPRPARRASTTRASCRARTPRRPRARNAARIGLRRRRPLQGGCQATLRNVPEGSGEQAPERMFRTCGLGSFPTVLGELGGPPGLLGTTLGDLGDFWNAPQKAKKGGRAECPTVCVSFAELVRKSWNSPGSLPTTSRGPANSPSAFWGNVLASCPQHPAGKHLPTLPELSQHPLNSALRWAPTSRT